jgi:hypothetical protein
MSEGSSAEPIAASNSDASISEKVPGAAGPVQILGASGFVGANLMRLLVGLRCGRPSKPWAEPCLWWRNFPTASPLCY